MSSLLYTCYVWDDMTCEVSIEHAHIFQGAVTNIESFMRAVVEDLNRQIADDVPTDEQEFLGVEEREDGVTVAHVRDYRMTWHVYYGSGDDGNEAAEAACRADLQKHIDGPAEYEPRERPEHNEET